MQRKVYLTKEWFISSKLKDINEDYLMMSELGAGAYGKVYLRKTSVHLSYRAIKVIQKARVEDYTSFTNGDRHLEKAGPPQYREYNRDLRERPSLLPSPRALPGRGVIRQDR